MAVTSKVITLNQNDPETSINNALSALSIAKADFIDAIVIAQEGKNQVIKLVVFYDN